MPPTYHLICPFSLLIALQCSEWITDHTGPHIWQRGGEGGVVNWWSYWISSRLINLPLRTEVNEMTEIRYVGVWGVKNWQARPAGKSEIAENIWKLLVLFGWLCESTPVFIVYSRSMIGAFLKNLGAYMHFVTFIRLPRQNLMTCPCFVMPVTPSSMICSPLGSPGVGTFHSWASLHGMNSTLDPALTVSPAPPLMPRHIMSPLLSVYAACIIDPSTPAGFGTMVNICEVWVALPSLAQLFDRTLVLDISVTPLLVRVLEVTHRGISACISRTHVCCSCLLLLICAVDVVADAHVAIAPVASSSVGRDRDRSPPPPSSCAWHPDPDSTVTAKRHHIKQTPTWPDEVDLILRIIPLSLFFASAFVR